MRKKKAINLSKPTIPPKQNSNYYDYSVYQSGDGCIYPFLFYIRILLITSLLIGLVFVVFFFGESIGGYMKLVIAFAIVEFVYRKLGFHKVE